MTRQLQRSLDSLGAPARKEDRAACECGAGEVEDLGGETLCNFRSELAGVNERQLSRLFGHGAGNVINPEADEVYGRAAREIDIFTPVDVPYASAFSAGGDGIVLGE